MNEAKSLRIAFLWHMHQPYYKDPKSGEYQMPWVRLHGLKDYYDMVAILDDFPKIKQNFNLVPSLIEQIEDYANGNAYDRHLILTEKAADKLEPVEKEEILSTFFMGYPKTMIEPFRRFYQLYEKRGNDPAKFPSVVSKFSRQDFLDIQVWSNLVWFDPIFRREPEIAKLFKKGENFTEEEKKIVLKKEKAILSSIIPKYKELQEKGQIEVSVSPYFHPILPLLYDTTLAKVAMPTVPLPQTFSHPEDALKQIEMAVEFYQKIFEKKPQGMWPSEGSVCDEIIPLIAQKGIEWIATDEEILYLSLPYKKDKTPESYYGKDILHQPYRLKINGSELSIVFRDHVLSDLIGFVYSRWKAQDAVEDFLGKLHKIRSKLDENELNNYLVTIILDGENAWEYYSNDGHDFLSLLYRKLSSDPFLETTTISEFLKEKPPSQVLPKLFAGSWIQHNFKIWIGHEEDNLSWEFLRKTRETLVDFQRRRQGKVDPGILAKAWKEIYIAEGSDWNWWYGDEHLGPQNIEFDRIYRSHLLNVYELLNLEPPETLYQPIKSKIQITQIFQPTGYITPALDGKVTNYYEWSQAGFFDCLKAGSSMHRSVSIVKGIYFGFDKEKLYFRIDTVLPALQYQSEDYVFQFDIFEPAKYHLKIMQNQAQLLGHSSKDDSEYPAAANILLAISKIIELSLPWEAVGIQTEKDLVFSLSVKKGGNELEKWPTLELIQLHIPDEMKKPTFWEV
jgi:alpha-amylase/alpha-mannosidase (GH57 family)